MASKGKITEIIDTSAVQKQIDTVVVGLNSILDKIESIAGAANTLKFDFGKAKNLKEVATASEELQTQMKQLEPAQKELIKLEQQRITLTAKLASLESEAAKQAAELQAQIRQRNADINNEIKLNTAKAGSLTQMSAELAKLQKEYENLSRAERKSAQGTDLLNKIQQLDAALKEEEESLGKFFRSVGNYEKGTRGLKQQMADIANELAQMKQQGLDGSEGFNSLQAKLNELVGAIENSNASFREQKMVMTEQLAVMKQMGLDGTEAYDMLRQKLGELTDAFNDASAEAQHFASDTRTLDSFISAAEGVAGAYTAMEGASALLGVENEDLQQTFVKLQAAMATLNGLKAIQNVLQKESAAYIAAENLQRRLQVTITWLQNKAETGGIVTRKLATAAQWALNKAMAANPAGLLVTVLLALVGVGIALYKIFGDNAEIQKEYSHAITQTTKAIENMNRELDRNVRLMEDQGAAELDIIRTRIQAALQEYNQRQDLIDKLISGYHDLTDEQKDQLKELQKAQSENNNKVAALNDDLQRKTIEGTREAQKKRLETMKDGLNKELALLDLDYSEQIKKAQGNATLVAALEGELGKKKSDIRRKYAEDWLKQEQSTIAALNEARIGLMVEGFTKDLAELRESYRQRIEALETQLKTEEDLTIAQKKRIRETIKSIAQQQAKEEEEIIRQNELKSLKLQEEAINLRLTAVRKGSAEELELKIKSLNTLRKAELIEAEKTKQDVALINAKYDAQIAEESYNAAISMLDKESQKKLLALNQQYYQERELLDNQLRENLLSIEEYEAKKLALESKYSREGLKNAIDVAQQKLDSLPADYDKTDAQKALNDAMNDLYEEDFENYKIVADKKLALQQEYEARLFDLASTAMSSIVAMQDAYLERRLTQLDEESEADEKAKERELALAGDNQEAQDKIEAKYLQREQAREKERAKIERQKAIAQRAASIFEIGINSFQSVANIKMKAAELAANPLTLPLVPLALAQIPIVLATAALQVGAIMAQPLPEYFKGRDGGPAEWAWVGERGTERIDLPGGDSFLTPDKPTLAFLPEGASVIPHHELFEDVQRFGFPDLSHAPGWAGDAAIRDLRADIQGLHKDFEMLADVVKNKKETHIVIDKKGFSRYVTSLGNTTRWIEDNIKS